MAVADRIDLRIGLGDRHAACPLPPDEQFDPAPIDADKTGYSEYYEEILNGSAPVA